MATLDSAELNETFELLAHPYRRYVLYYLSKDTEVAGLDTLATALAKWDWDYEGMDRTATIEEVKTDLHHSHLPQLAEAGVITVGPNGDSIELEESDGLGEFLDDTARIDGYTPPVISN